MKETCCPRATVSFLNDFNQQLVNLLSDEDFRLQVNSILRPADHQLHLLSLGYLAPPISSHSTGYAIDIEKKWYYLYNQKAYTTIINLLKKLAGQKIITFIEENDVWHVCLTPSGIRRYEQ